MSAILLKGGRVIDPGSRHDGASDVLVEDGQVSRIEPGIAAGKARVVDCTDLIVAPGFVDLHARMREPGEEHEEDIATGSRAATAGGFTTVCVTPETDPVNDSRAVTEYVLRRAREVGLCRIRPMGALTKGRKGESMAELADLRAAGCVAVTDGDRPVMNAAIMRRALEYAHTFGIVISVFAEDSDLAAGGVVNEGDMATRAGLRGRATVAETAFVARDLHLVAYTGARLHFSRVSTAGSVALLRDARRAGLPVTAAVSAHHVAFTDEACAGYDPNTKCLPPLRAAADVDALRAGLADGTIDALVSDHAPQAVVDKEYELDDAAFGIMALETVLPLGLDLVASGVLSLGRLVELLTSGPARVFGLDAGRLAAGGPADITVFDPGRRWTPGPATLRSKARNTPLLGRELRGRVVLTLVGGTVSHEESR